MKEQTFSSLGLDVSFSVPKNVEEFDQNAGKVGAALSEAINNVVYRSILNNYRFHFLHGVTQADLDEDKDHSTFREGVTPVKGVEELSGVARKTIAVLDKEQKPVMKDGEPVVNFDPEDSEAKYFKRVLAETKKEASAYQETANLVAGSMVFDASASERKAVGPKRLPAKYKEKAAAILSGTGLANFLANFETEVGRPANFTPTNDQTKLFSPLKVEGPKGVFKDYVVSDVDADRLGWLLKTYQDAKAAKALADMPI